MDVMVEDVTWQQIRQTGRLEGRRVHYFETVGSTNTLALEMGQAGEATGTVLVAETQTMGRGRLGKTWCSPPGTGLYCTVLLRPEMPVHHLPRITLAAGLAVARAIDDLSGQQSTIKWPNDVLLQGRKVAGILAECAMSGGERPLVALGVGINLGTKLEQFPQEVRPTASSLLLTSGRAIAQGLMLATLLRWIEEVMARLEQADFVGILDEWRTKDATVSQWLTWLTTDGRAVQGMSLGPDQEGLLVIRDKEGRDHHVLSGDIALDPNRLNGYFP